MLQWQLPIFVLVEQQLDQILRLWHEYLSCISRSFEDRNIYHKMLINPRQKIPSKLFIQIVYIIDYLVITKYQQFLRFKSFKIPILISIYILVSINVGDVHLKQNYIWPEFQRFLGLYQLLSDEEIHRLKVDVGRYFVELRIIEVLGKIPLNLKFQKLIKKWNQQFYIRKIQIYIE